MVDKICIYLNCGNVENLTPQGPEDGTKYMNQKVNGVGRFENPFKDKESTIISLGRDFIITC